MMNRLNSKDYIYKKIIYWYENSNENIYNSILKRFSQMILNAILFNISFKDLKKLTDLKKTVEYETECYKKKPSNISLDILYNKQKEMQNIIDKNLNEFLKDSFETFERIIYKHD